MKPNNLSVFNLFQMERRYVVPLFQRPYVWSQETQWGPLWEDVKAKANEVLEQREDDLYPIRKHFLGAAVINQIRTFGLHTSAMEVIDGQQRLTTLQVLLCSLKDWANENGFNNFARKLERLTENSLSVEGEEEKYKVWPTSGDRAVYESVFAATSPDNLRAEFPLQYAKYARKPSPRPRLVEAYLYFYSMIGSYLDETDTSAEGSEENLHTTRSRRLEALVNAITLYLEVVVIELEENDDPQVIFETLNARGEPLLPSDLIRNFVFLEATRQKENVAKLYREYWRKYDDDAGQEAFWKQQQTQGRLKRSRFDLFIFHYLTEQTERQLPIKHLYQEFRDWWLRNRPRVEPGLEDLQTAGEAYRSFFETDTNSRLSVFCNRLAQLDTGTVYPLLLFLTSQRPASSKIKDRLLILVDLESYLIRRLVCGLTPKDYNNVFLSLLKEAKKEILLDRVAFRRLLSNLQGSSRRWPTDVEFGTAWNKNRVYDTLGARRVALVLEALDLQMETSKQEKIHIESMLTVEHIMPQNWNEQKWPFEEMKNTEEEHQEQIAQRNDVLQTFGNLTLLTQPLNSSVGNNSFSQKRQGIAGQSKLRLNTYFQTFSNADAWNEEAIKTRGDILLQIALQIWPGPDG